MRSLPVLRARSLTTALAFTVLTTCGGGGGSGTTNPPPPAPTLGSITLSPATIASPAGTITQLTAAALDQQGALIDGVTGYTFASSAPTVAEVSASGLVVAVSAGQATITASLARDGVTRTATAGVTVTGTLPDRAAITATVDNVFSPKTVVISRGGQVTFNFVGTANVNFQEAGAPPNILTMTGSVVDRTFTIAGDFNYTCSLHGGMIGLVKVR